MGNMTMTMSQNDWNFSTWDDFYTLMPKSYVCFSISWLFFLPFWGGPYLDPATKSFLPLEVNPFLSNMIWCCSQVFFLVCFLLENLGTYLFLFYNWIAGFKGKVDGQISSNGCFPGCFFFSIWKKKQKRDILNGCHLPSTENALEEKSTVLELYNSIVLRFEEAKQMNDPTNCRTFHGKKITRSHFWWRSCRFLILFKINFCPQNIWAMKKTLVV